MNSHWAEHYARQHVEGMAADARGDRLVQMADQRAPKRPDAPSPSPIRRARTWIHGLATRRGGAVMRARW